MSLPEILSASRRRNFVIILTAFALALVALISPSLTKPAHADFARNVHMSSATETHLAYLMLGALNNERRWNHLPPVTMDRRLVISAWRHNMDMGAHNSMSHQLPGESYFATRIGRTGYDWRTAGENIGWTGSISLQGLYNLEHMMYVERAPNNGHRLNILSRSFRQVGISVVYDVGHRKLWFTQDFGQLM